jgi:peroxiredoxin
MNTPLRALVSAAALAAAVASSGCAIVSEGRPAPPLEGDLWVGTGGADIEKRMKDRWVLMVFFRPESEACVRDMPAIRALRDQFSKKGLVVVGVTASDWEEAEEFMEAAGVDFPVLTDGYKMLNAYGVPEVHANETFLINPPGVVVAQSDIPATARILEKYLVR